MQYENLPSGMLVYTMRKRYAITQVVKTSMKKSFKLGCCLETTLKDPTAEVEHLDISGGAKISNELKHFSVIALDNHKRCITCMIEEQPFTNEIVFVADEERSDHHKIEITTKTFEMLDEMDDQTKSLYLDYFRKEMKKKKKKFLVDFYKDVLDVCDGHVGDDENITISQ